MASSLFAMFAALILLALPAKAEGLRVVASIKPLQSLAAGVMDGVGMPEVVIKGGASLHAYALRPSDATALNQAQVIFWVGPVLETFLEKPLVALGQKARVVTLSKSPDVKVLPARQGGLWEMDESNGGVDGHIWLDSGNAKAIVSVMAETLADVDQDNAQRYHSNAAALLLKLDALDADVRATLAQVQSKPFVVFHDAYQYFERSYGLRALGSITVSAERAAGARRVNQIKERLGTSGDICVFAEPQFEPKLVRMLAIETGAKTGVLDPEGSVLPSGPDLYFDLMRGLAANLTRCLAP